MCIYMHICMAYTCNKISCCNIMQHHVTSPHELRDPPLCLPLRSWWTTAPRRRSSAAWCGACGAIATRRWSARIRCSGCRQRSGKAWCGLDAERNVGVGSNHGGHVNMYSNKVLFFGEGEGLGICPHFLFRLYIYIDIHSIFAGLCLVILGTVHILL